VTGGKPITAKLPSVSGVTAITVLNSNLKSKTSTATEIKLWNKGAGAKFLKSKYRLNCGPTVL
jgi:hypothetical protein